VRSVTRLLSKLLVTIGLLSGPAAADTLSWGFVDSSIGGSVTPFASTSGPPGTMLSLVQSLLVADLGLTKSTQFCARSPTVRSDSTAALMMALRQI
jgi:hypothetical protein